MLGTCLPVAVLNGQSVGGSLGESMTTHFDVPADLLLAEVSARLQDVETITKPEWAENVKTGVHRERAPVQEDWWQTRCAALLRKVARKGPIGVNHLAGEYGGSRDRDARPNRAKAGSRHVIRTALQQLENSGLISMAQLKTIETQKGEKITLHKGRIITKQGQGLLDTCAHQVRNSVEADISKY